MARPKLEVSVEPEKIAILLPNYTRLYLSLGQARDLLDDLQKLFAQRVKDGKGLL